MTSESRRCRASLRYDHKPDALSARTPGLAARDNNPDLRFVRKSSGGHVMSFRSVLILAALAVPASVALADTALVSDPDSLPKISCDRQSTYSAALAEALSEGPGRLPGGRVAPNGDQYAQVQAKVYLNSARRHDRELLNVSGDPISTFSFKGVAGRQGHRERQGREHQRPEARRSDHVLDPGEASRGALAAEQPRQVLARVAATPGSKTARTVPERTLRHGAACLLFARPPRARPLRTSSRRPRRSRAPGATSPHLFA